MPTTLVVIPTYNERANLESVVARVTAAVPDTEVLIVDDNSPDGTGELADALAAASALVHVLHRPGKGGLGQAYRAGFSWGLERGYDYLVEMDGDGSHDPDQLPALLAALGGADLAIGTRWMPGGQVHNWPLSRRLLSRGGTAFARIMLRSHLRDITSGYRAFRAATLRSQDVGSVSSQGYGFQVELAWRAERSGLVIAEVPISFTEREGGSSKMSAGIVLEAMWRVFIWGIADRVRPRRP